MNTGQKLVRRKNGFTLLEMLIVMTIVALILPTVFAIVFVIMRQQVRIYRVVETRRQGDFILSFIKDKLIRSKQITNFNSAPPPVSYTIPYCTSAGSSKIDPGGNTVGFFDQNDVTYRLYQSSGSPNLSYESGALTTPLNTANILISNFTISCYRSAANATPLITISYTIQYKDDTPTPEEGNVSLTYQTKVRLRE